MPQHSNDPFSINRCTWIYRVSIR